MQNNMFIIFATEKNVFAKQIWNRNYRKFPSQ